MNDTDTLNLLNISYDLIEPRELILSWLNQKLIGEKRHKKKNKANKQEKQKKKTGKEYMA